MIESLLHIFGAEVTQLVLKLVPYFRALRFWFWGRSERIRISLCAFAIVRRQNRYALIESMHRPGSFGPIGGIMKYHEPALELVRHINFDPQYKGGVENLDIKDDLRGYVAGYKLFSLIKWFNRETDRETGIECLNREFREELAEINAPFSSPDLSSQELDLVRTISEGPYPVKGRDYRWQFTIMQIFELKDTPKTSAFLRDLEALGLTSERFAFATSDEVLAGRFQRVANTPNRRRQIIGAHVEYLLRPYSERSVEPPTWF